MCTFQSLTSLCIYWEMMALNKLLETYRLFLQICSICSFSSTSKTNDLQFHLQAGAIEGQVVEMGLMTTSLLSAEKFPIVVPNSLFSSQVNLLFFLFCFFVLGFFIYLLYHHYLHGRFIFVPERRFPYLNCLLKVEAYLTISFHSRTMHMLPITWLSTFVVMKMCCQ